MPTLREEETTMEIEAKKKEEKESANGNKVAKRAPGKRRQRAIGLCHIVKFYFDLLVSIYFTHVVALLLMLVLVLLMLFTLGALCLLGCSIMTGK